MKNLNHIIGRLAMGSFVAFSLIANLQAQDQKASPPGTYYSAKDPDLVPLPFNPHPELPVVEVEKGIFVVDDTTISDTPQQLISRKLRQAAAERARAIASDPFGAEAAKAAQAAQEAAREAVVQQVLKQEYFPFSNQGIHVPDGLATSVEEIDANQTDALQSLAVQNGKVADADALEIDAVTSTNGLTRKFSTPDGSGAELMRIREGTPRYYLALNANAANTVSTSRVWPGGSTGMGLSGSNTVIALWDQGDVRTNHLEFTNGFRVIDKDGYSGGNDDHSTHVAGTLVAKGVDSAAKGMAYNATLHAYKWDSDLVEMPLAAANDRIRLSNHSYGYIMGWWYYQIGTNLYWAWYGSTNISQTEDYFFGFYGDDARAVDQIIYNANYYLTAWAAGNDRSGINNGPAPGTGHYIFVNGQPVPSFATRPADGDEGNYDTLSPICVAKNILTVGSVNDLVGGYTNAAGVTLSDFSSIGPTDDGRIKPDVLGNGDNLYSTLTNGSYGNQSGTSMATPNVTGSLDLLLELYQRLKGTNKVMLASTLRGIAIHTADEAGTNAGPDYRFGWGLLNTPRAALLIQSNFTAQALPHIKEPILNSGDNVEFPVVCSGTQSLKVTLAWTDPAGLANAAAVDPTNRALINDLDLRVVAPNGTTNYPWVLNPDLQLKRASVRGAAATTGDDALNNVEQVLITNTVAGTYLVRATHKGDLVNSSNQISFQRLSLVVSGNEPQPKPALVLTPPLLSQTNTVVNLKWPSVVGLRYRVQYKGDLNQTNWTDASGDISATKTNTAFSENLSSSNRFYRVMEFE
jgi:hypothetical protein